MSMPFLLEQEITCRRVVVIDCRPYLSFYLNGLNERKEGVEEDDIKLQVIVVKSDSGERWRGGRVVVMISRMGGRGGAGVCMANG